MRLRVDLARMESMMQWFAKLIVVLALVWIVVFIILAPLVADLFWALSGIALVFGVLWALWTLERK